MCGVSQDTFFGFPGVFAGPPAMPHGWSNVSSYWVLNSREPLCKVVFLSLLLLFMVLLASLVLSTHYPQSSFITLNLICLCPRHTISPQTWSSFQPLWWWPVLKYRTENPTHIHVFLSTLFISNSGLKSSMNFTDCWPSSLSLNPHLQELLHPMRTSSHASTTKLALCS